MNRALMLLALTIAAQASELRLTLHNEPKTLDPLLMADESAEAVRYLTEGVLIRINRLTRNPEPELAVSWSAPPGSRKVTFELRQRRILPRRLSLHFEGRRRYVSKLLDPTLHSPIADTFQTDKGTVKITAAGDYTVIAEFSAPPSGFERLFDQVAIVSAAAPKRPSPGLGPFLIAERTPGASITLKRNPKYWKKSFDGTALPRLDSIRLEIQENRDLEVMRLRRGELHLIDNLTPDLYDRLTTEAPGSTVDSGPTMDAEFLWFNLAHQAPIADYKKAWFQSTAFRRAISRIH